MSKRKKLISRLKEQYKLIILNDSTFEEKASFRASLWYFIIATFAFAIVLVFLTITIVKFTPLRGYLSGVADVSSKKDIMYAYLRADSLEKIVKSNELYLNNLKNVIEGNVGKEKQKKPEGQKARKSDSVVLTQKISREEKELRKLIESESQYNLNAKNAGRNDRGTSSYSFFSPVSQGKVTDKYNSQVKHYAVDIATKRNENIRAVLDGTVIFSSFTPDAGYVIGIQHANNMITFYKHCAVLLKKVGSFVNAGDIIAVVGNTGEFTTGYHLHFELWLNGSPVDPENYINF